jgi:hypothetical protein
MSKVQDAFVQFYPSYRNHHSLSPQQAKATLDIMRCKTAALGVHVFECEECGHQTISYNSCRNRHCPSCQGLNNAVWVDARSQDILNAPYFHVVFTMPGELHQLIYQNQRLLYDLMYKAVTQTLFELSRDKKYLGAQPGFFSVLHTWGQDLHFHPHIHIVILAGGLNKMNEWRSSSKKFFIPVKVLSKKFRGKYLHYLKLYYQENMLKFYGDAKQYDSPQFFQYLLDQCYEKDWYSYTKEPFSSPLAVVKYLGRYTHRIAISNHRIVAMDDNTVTIAVKDYKEGSKKSTVTLTGVEFIRRFLMHILPKGFRKIRHYGILANRNKKTKLALCRKLTRSPAYKAKFEGLTTIEIVSLLAGRDVTICPACKKCKLKEVSSSYLGKSP